MTKTAWVTIHVNGRDWSVTNNVQVFQSSQQVVYYCTSKKKHFFYLIVNGKHVVCSGAIQSTRLLPQLHATVIERDSFSINDIQKVNKWKTGVIDLGCRIGDHCASMGSPEQNLEIIITTAETSTTPIDFCIEL